MGYRGSLGGLAEPITNSTDSVVPNKGRMNNSKQLQSFEATDNLGKAQGHMPPFRLV